MGKRALVCADKGLGVLPALHGCCTLSDRENAPSILWQQPSGKSCLHGSGHPGDS